MLRYMALQVWIFAPSIRHENMILDINNWDLKPEPLCEIKVPTISNTTTNNYDLPWK